MTQRTKATEGTQAHRDLATIKNNINYWIKVHGMDRDDAKAKVNHPNYVMMDAETINREVAAEKSEEPKAKIDRIKGASVTWNGNVYKNLADAIRASSPKYQGAENRAAACKRWTLVRAGLLKTGTFQDAKNTFSM